MTKQQKELVQYLLLQYMDGKSSDQELARLSFFLTEETGANDWEDIMEELFAAEAPMEGYNRKEWEPVISELILKNARRARIRWIRRIAVAASVIAVIGGSYFIINQHKEAPKEIVVAPKNQDVAPGGNKAILTLGSGAKIILDSARNGLLAEQNGSDVSKTDSGKLAYHSTSVKNAVVVYNTLTTPRGGQYQLTLPDGTKVWLNAASSITYPTSFTGKERKVSITGEAYFEVMHNVKQPFIVSVDSTEIKDIGTHFNINAYPDEIGLKTSLLQGSVKVTVIKTSQSAILSPGEQADLKDDHLAVVKKVNMEEVVAWKEGSFHFESADLKTILRQFARWYDVEVVYEGTLPDEKYFVLINRSRTLASVLKALQTSSIQFTIENKKLIVKPK